MNESKLILENLISARLIKENLKNIRFHIFDESDFNKNFLVQRA